jgi:hypothetical protein
VKSSNVPLIVIVKRVVVVDGNEHRKLNDTLQLLLEVVHGIARVLVQRGTVPAREKRNIEIDRLQKNKKTSNRIKINANKISTMKQQTKIK